MMVVDHLLLAHEFSTYRGMVTTHRSAIDSEYVVVAGIHAVTSRCKVVVYRWTYWACVIVKG